MCFRVPGSVAPNIRKVIVALETVSEPEQSAWKQKLGKLFPALSVTEKTFIEEKIDTIRMHSQHNSIQRIMYKYFGNYNDRPCDLYNVFACKYHHYFTEGNYSGNIDKIRSYFFAGIKFYPPLGFDPAPPANNQNVIDKLNFIYEFCAHRQIPITVHIHMDSFDTVCKKEKTECTNPLRWQKVLERYPRLKVNFAHMGMTDTERNWHLSGWAKTVIRYIQDKRYNIFTDISWNGRKTGFCDFYKNFQRILDAHQITPGSRSLEKILFGTDFMLHLFKDDSYKQYLAFFLNSKYLKQDKILFYNKNPRQFLFNDHDS